MKDNKIIEEKLEEILLLQYQAEQARIERVAQIKLNEPFRSWEEAEVLERGIRDFNIGRELLKNE